jgi:hypothetical protein
MKFFRGENNGNQAACEYSPSQPRNRADKHHAARNPITSRWLRLRPIGVSDTVEVQ